MAKDIVQTEMRRRQPLRATGGAAPPEEKKGKGFNPIASIANLPKFAREVQAEARKVTWTSWKETWITSVFVGIMVTVTSLFLFGVDQGLSHLVDFIFQLAGSGGGSSQ